MGPYSCTHILNLILWLSYLHTWDVSDVIRNLKISSLIILDVFYLSLSELKLIILNKNFTHMIKVTAHLFYVELITRVDSLCAFGKDM